ncbi:MAG TPA: hypothetical protein VHM70_15320 [Polyangiaceae bacterium]|jgi:hypothetical protein|nr:hypothetical protein [Polyangiaceae bacterium]
MNRPQNFKFDVRVRERLMAQGGLTAEDLEVHLGKLQDCEDDYDVVDLEQPALVTEKAPPPPVAPMPGLPVSGLSPIQSSSPVRPIEAGVGLVGGRVSPFEPAPKVSPFEGIPRVSPFEPAPKVNPFEPEPIAASRSAYEPAPRIPVFEPAPRVSPFEPAPKINPFEPAPKVSPFEGGPAVSPYEPAPPLPPTQPNRGVPGGYGAPNPTPMTSPLPAYRQPQVHAEPPRNPGPAFPTSPFAVPPVFPGGGPVSPMQPSPLVSPFEPIGAPAPRTDNPAPAGFGPDGLPRRPGGNDPHNR